MSNVLQVSDILRKRHELLKSARSFFYKRGFIEVETANLMRAPAPDPNIEPLEVFAGKSGPFYLHTSPEMGMKKLLASSGIQRMFQICKVYRVEEYQQVHSTEFTMLEWYRDGNYENTMEETNALISCVAEDLLGDAGKSFQTTFDRYDLKSLFIQKTGINPFGLSRDEFLNEIQNRGFRGMDRTDTLESLFFKLFIQEIEPALPKQSPYFITGWPEFISTMAKTMDGNPHQVERFELYMGELEIANGYTELTNAREQRTRFRADNTLREKRGTRTFSVDEEFLAALDKIGDSCSGVSIGVDRLLMALLSKNTIDDVMPYRFKV